MIGKFMLWIFSQTLILNATCKEKFGSGEQWKDLNLFSAIFVNLGSVRLFFFSYDSSGKNFKIIRVLRYADVAIWPTERNIQDVMQRNSPKFIEKNVAVFEYKLAQEVERFSIAMGKIPNYITVIVFVIPLYYALFAAFSKHIIVIGFAILAVYLLIGCIVIVCHILSVKGSDRSTADEIIKDAVKSKYFDWQIRKRENDYYVGLVKNLERMFLFSMIFAVISGVIGLSVTSTALKKQDKTEISKDSTPVKENRKPNIDLSTIHVHDSTPRMQVKVDSLDSTKRNVPRFVIVPSQPLVKTPSKGVNHEP